MTKRCRFFAVWLCVSTVAASGRPAAASVAQRSGGAVVESVASGSGAQRAGLQPDDLITSWHREADPPANPEAASGPIRSPFDLALVELEQAPRGPVTLRGRRGAKELRWLMPSAVWGLDLLPRLSSSDRAAHQEARAVLAAGNPSDALARWEGSAKQAGGLAAAWMMLTSGKSLAGKQATTHADRAFEGASRYTQSRDVFARYWINRQWGDVLRARSAWDDALLRYRTAGESLGPGTEAGLAAAGVEASLGAVEGTRGNRDVAVQHYRRALAMRQQVAPESMTVARTLNALSELTKAGGDLVSAEAYQRSCVDLLRKLAPESLDLAQGLGALASVTLVKGDAPAAETIYLEALAIAERVAPDSIDVARMLHGLGVSAWMRTERIKAMEYSRRAVALKEKLVPGSLDLAGSLTGLGAVTMENGDLAAAEGYYLRSLEICEKLAPKSLAVARNLNNLGNLALARGDLDAAGQYLRASSEIWEAQSPGSLEVATGLLNRGNVAWSRGDIAEAEELYVRSLAIREKLAPDSLAVAQSLNALGLVAMDRGDVAAAEEYHKRALTIYEKQAPKSREFAGSLSNLGRVKWLEGDSKTATEQYGRALEVAESLGAGGRDLLALVLNNLGAVILDGSDPGSAEPYFRRALAIREELAPGGLDVASSLHSLAVLAGKRGDLPGAEDFARRAVLIRERLAPGSADEADALNELGRALRRMGRLDQAAEHLCGAVKSIERQKGKIGGSESLKSTFAARYGQLYHDCAVALVELGRGDEAFHILERSRARSLLAMLAERELHFSDDVPPTLERESRLTDAEYDRTQSLLAGLNPSQQAGEIEQALTRLRELRTKQEDLEAQIRKASPRFATLKYPEPLDVAGVRAMLDEGTVLLAFSVGKDETMLFVVSGRDGESRPAVFKLPVAEGPLREQVQAFRNLLQRADPTGLAQLRSRGSQLYDLLLKPAERSIARGERLLIMPDGPLHRMPFTALVRRNGARRTQYVAEWKAVHVAVSATVYAELKRARRSIDTATARLVAFGDPKYPSLPKDKPEEVADGEVRSVLRGGFGFNPLPASRQEVEQIASLYADRAQAYLGPEATEERAKAVGKDARYLHFATHGYVNERFPLDSALVLTIPEKLETGRDNGLLQAWEVFDRVRIDADLVALSACETGLGKELGGEGLIGLTRAFQYAGARSVLASLWSVSDESTASLMASFYGHLKSGHAKDEALRSAQVEMISSKGSHAHPFHWAGFQMIGDWR